MLTFAVMILLVGIGLLLFPTVSNSIGKRIAGVEADDYEETVENITETVTAEDGTAISSLAEAREKGYIDEEGFPVESITYNANGKTQYGGRILYQKDISDLLADSIAYNEMLLNGGQGTEETVRYDRAAFDLRDYGIDDNIYAIITIDAIDVRLPVYLGSEYTIMSYGAAHLYGTSLPVGEGSYNCAIAGHTNYPGRIFFDNLKKLQIGDTVKLTTYWDTDEYEVIDHKIIKPDVADDLLIRDGRQLLTLITCIWTGKGSEFDRYLVICEKK